MPQCRPLYDPHQTTAKATEQPPPAAPSSRVAEPAPPAYAIEPAWIDAAGRVTWEMTLSISRRSPSVSSTLTEPMFSSRRSILRLPGMGTIHLSEIERIVI